MCNLTQNSNFEVPVIVSGHNFYQSSLKELFGTIPDNKYNCEAIISPIDKMTVKLREIKQKQYNLNKNLHHIYSICGEIDGRIKSLTNYLNENDGEIRNLQFSLHKPLRNGGNRMHFDFDKRLPPLEQCLGPLMKTIANNDYINDTEQDCKDDEKERQQQAQQQGQQQQEQQFAFNGTLPSHSQWNKNSNNNVSGTRFGGGGGSGGDDFNQYNNNSNDFHNSKNSNGNNNNNNNANKPWMGDGGNMKGRMLMYGDSKSNNENGSNETDCGVSFGQAQFGFENDNNKNDAQKNGNSNSQSNIGQSRNDRYVNTYNDAGNGEADLGASRNNNNFTSNGNGNGNGNDDDWELSLALQMSQMDFENSNKQSKKEEKSNFTPGSPEDEYSRQFRQMYKQHQNNRM